jgi:hypothetical protein
MIHVEHDYDEACEESNVDEEEAAMEEAGGRITRDIREGYDFNIKDVQGRLSYAESLETLKKKQIELEKERSTLIEERKHSPHIFHSNMWFYDAQLMDAVHKLERLKQRLKEKLIPNQTEIQKLLQQRFILRLNFNDRWALYR